VIIHHKPTVFKDIPSVYGFQALSDILLCNENRNVSLDLLETIEQLRD
jgi:hypothetical protein